jgi:hypothetical protein
MAQNTIQKPLPGTNSWFALFAVIDSILWLLIPAISKLMIVLFLFNLQWFDNPLMKLVFAMFVAYSIGGFWVFGVKIKEYFEEAFIPFQRGKYMAKSPQKPMTIELIIPTDFKYDPTTFVGYFFYMGNTFKTTNVTKQVQYNYGRWFSNITFDQIAHKGQIRTYATFPQKKYNEFVEMYKRFFPEIHLRVCDDPFKEWPKEWDTGKKLMGYDRVVGFNLGNSKSNTFPLVEGSELNPDNMPMDMFMRAVRDTLPNEIVVFQNIFRFNPGNWAGQPDGEYHKEFTKWRDDILNQYAPMANGKMDTHAFEAFLPKWAHHAISKISMHLKNMYPSYTFRIMALTTDANDEYVYSKLEKWSRVYTGNTYDDADNDISIQYPTCTHQEYAPDRKAGNPKYQLIYDTMVFPDWYGDQFEALISPLYEKYYYPNENRYRQKNIYKTTVKRDLNAPWNGDWNLTDALGMSGFFSFPSKSSVANPIEMVISEHDLETKNSVYREAYE